ncbi:MAG: hypothetical protein RL710_2207 [Pseudomonadota bacterium]
MFIFQCCIAPVFIIQICRYRLLNLRMQLLFL